MNNKQEKNIGLNFSKNLTTFRKAKGFTQKELAKKVGTSQRMIAMYEGKDSKYIPAQLLPAIATALKISTDELLGLQKIKSVVRMENASLWRKFKKIEHLPQKDQKALFQLLDALLKKVT